jgi:hypothetical protein
MKLRRNFSQQTPLIHSTGPKTYVSGSFRPFHYCTKLDAKLAELAPLTPKFAKRSCVRTFRNECTASTPLNPKLMFRHVSNHFITLWKLIKLAELAPLTLKFVKRSWGWIFRNERTWSTQLDPKTQVLGHFGPFRYCTKVDAKLAELVPLTHKFAQRSCVEIFHNERTW